MEEKRPSKRCVLVGAVVLPTFSSQFRENGLSFVEGLRGDVSDGSLLQNGR